MNYQDSTSEKHERLARELSGGRTYQPNTIPDPYDQAQHRADVLRGRDREAWEKWRQVMSYFGFIWMEPEQLNACPYVGPIKVVIQGSQGSTYRLRSHKVGQWRRWAAPTSKHINRDWWMGLTMDDLLSMWESPERFDAWIRIKDDRIRAKHLGYKVLPDALRKPKYQGAPNVQVAGALLVNQPEAEETKRPSQRPIDEPMRL